MTRIMFERVLTGTALGGLLLWGISPAAAQTGAKNGEWRTYGADLGNTQYSPLDQINAANFNKLEVAWRFQTETSAPAGIQNEGTPLMVERRHLRHGRNAPRT